MNDSATWARALRKAYPGQEPHLRPSSMANCARQVAGMVYGNGLHKESEDRGSVTIWPAEMGRAGEEIALNAFQYFGFKIERSVKLTQEDSVLPGEIDAIGEAEESNLWNIPEGTKFVIDVKIRNVYAWTVIWNKDPLDLMSIDAGIGLQQNTYMGQSGIKKGMILLLPHDSSAVRNTRNKAYADSGINHYIRVFTYDFNPELFAFTMQRAAEIEMYGVNVAPDYDPTQGKFPCVWATGECSVREWCLAKGPNGTPITPIPTRGMPMEELFVP